jgi:peptidoglycan/LPS O-acetylase OafA/YrhL
MRIYPAYIAAILFSALVAGPVLTVLENKSLSNYLNASPEGPLTYIVKNSFMPIGLQQNLNGLTSALPFPGINGSLWTLPLEVRAYLVAGFVGILAKFFNAQKVVIGLNIILFSYFLVLSLKPNLANHIFPNWITSSPVLLTNFAIGGLIAIYAKKFKFLGFITFLLVATFFLAEFIGGTIFMTLGLGLLAIILPIFANLLRLKNFKFFDNDLSYGVYLYAFPVQQIVVTLIGERTLLRLLIPSTFITLALAFLSWFFVEKRSISFAKKYKT